MRIRKKTLRTLDFLWLFIFPNEKQEVLFWKQKTKWLTRKMTRIKEDGFQNIRLPDRNIFLKNPIWYRGIPDSEPCWFSNHHAPWCMLLVHPLRAWLWLHSDADHGNENVAIQVFFIVRPKSCVIISGLRLQILPETGSSLMTLSGYST